MNSCLICSAPTPHKFCKAHARYGSKATDVRREFERGTFDMTKQTEQSFRALEVYKGLSADGQYGISLLCATLMLRADDCCERRNVGSSGMGSLAALEIIVGLMQAKCFEKEETR